jgi:hypothetical protein
MTLDRRAFLLGTLALSATLPACVGQRRRGTLLSAFEDARGDQYIGGLMLEQERMFGARVPTRAHGCAIDPRNLERAIFFARRPGTQAFELDVRSQQVRQIFETPPGRHLSGHGAFSASGELLFTPEHDYERVRGVICVRDTRDFSLVREIDTHGIDPHELAWLPGHRRLLVANGGIMTHPRTYRRKLNIDTMDPSLCAIDAVSGDCVEQWRLPDHLLSIRHLSVAEDGTAAVGLQYEGNRERAPCVVALYRPGAGLKLLNTPDGVHEHFAGYIASVGISDAANLIAASCPYGRGVACWSKRSGAFRGFVAARDAFGLSQLADGSMVVSQRDGGAFEIDESRLRSQFLNIVSTGPIRWDDHWVAVG